MENHLKRVLDLVQKTGDTMIVVDKQGDDAFVVMDLDQYEAILDAQFQDKAEWEDEMFEEEAEVDSEEKQDLELPPRAPDIWGVMQGAEKEGETWDIDQLSEGELAELERQYQAFASRHVEEAIDEIEVNPVIDQKEPKIEKPIQDDVYGEEQFYLEPIE
ncbi:hypothetical protein HQ487_01850 [Candidatus Uhrbacteria bacterium]|nr:hypothetical protein [Candidatus Uhrbacteria bacterium]